MKTSAYYKRVLEAVKADRELIGAGDPQFFETLRAENDELRKEVKRRRKVDLELEKWLKQQPLVD